MRYLRSRLARLFSLAPSQARNQRPRALPVLAPLVLCAAFAALPAMARASVLDDGAGNPLRDDTVEAPTGGGFGADILGVNTDGPLRLVARVGAEPQATNENPAGYAFFGLKVDENPTATPRESGCEEATGWVQFADVQNAEFPGVAPSPVYSGTAEAAPARGHGGNGPWPFRVRSDNCATDPGGVTIENVSLYFPVLEARAVGTFAGSYVQPSGGETPPCPGGGVELDVSQPGVTVVPNIGEPLEASIDDGPAGGNAFICFVSSNNALYPTTAPSWAPFSDEFGSEVPGIFKD